MAIFIPPKLTVCKIRPTFHGKQTNKIYTNEENNFGSRLASVHGDGCMLQRLVQRLL